VDPAGWAGGAALAEATGATEGTAATEAGAGAAAGAAAGGAALQPPRIVMAATPRVRKVDNTEGIISVLGQVNEVSVPDRSLSWPKPRPPSIVLR
jgi:hypothetical protein